MPEESGPSPQQAGPPAGPSDAVRPAPWAHPVDESKRAARARRHRRRRWALALALLAVVAVVGLYAHLTSDTRVEAYAEAYLTELVGSRVKIGHASFTAGEGLVLDDLRVYPPEPFTEPILEAERVDLQIESPALAWMKLEVTEIVVHRPRVTLVQSEAGTWNFQAMATERPPGVRLAARPVVSLEDGVLRIRRPGPEPETPGESREPDVHEMQIGGLVIPSETDRDAFRFQTDVTTPEVRLAVTSGTLDVRTGALAFEGQASNVALVPELYRSLPREVRLVWDRYQPEGSMNLKVRFDEREGLRLQATLTGVAFTFGYEGQPHAFENLTGRATISASGVRLETVQGMLDGVSVRLEGTVENFDRERLSVDLLLAATDVPLEEKRATLVGLHPNFARIYEHYDPTGRVDLTMHLVRGPAADAPLEATGAIACRDVTMTYFRFPYRLDRVRGPIEFGPEGIHIESLEGYHGASPVQMWGVVTNPGPAWGTEFHIDARGVPLDEDLRAALTDHQRTVYDEYRAAGRADIRAVVTRPPIQGHPLRTVVRAHLRDCTFTYTGFPYTLAQATGLLVIGPDETEIRDVRGRHGEAEVAITGRIGYREDGPAAVHLQIDGRDVALDEELETALPERERESFQAFHLAGRADIQGTIDRGPQTDDELVYDLAVTLKGARMIYERFPFLAEDVTGRVHLTRRSARIESIEGASRGARIRATGWIEHRPDDYALDLVVEGADVPLTEQLRGALGPQVRAAWSHVDPEGRVDVRAHLEKAFGPDETLRHHVRVRARDLKARLDVFPYPLEHISGLLEFEGDTVRLRDLRARTGPTEFRLEGEVRYPPESGPEVALSIEATGLRLEGPLARAVPAPLKAAFERLGATGRVDLDITDLRYRTGPDGQARASWTAEALLDGLAMTAGVRIAHVVGAGRMTGTYDAGRLAATGELWIQEGRVADKDVEDLQIPFAKVADDDRLAFGPIEGTFYGGRIEGRAGLVLGGKGRYGLALAAVGVDFERLLREGFRVEHDIEGGRLEGTLAVQARGGEGSDAAASGWAEIHDAKLYELPLVVRILNALRLAPVDRTAFTEARIQYFVRDGRFILSDVRLMGPALSLYGAGTVEPDGRLALRFVPGRRDDTPLVGVLAELAEGVRKELATVHVEGTMAAPEVRIETLSSLSAPLREFLAIVRESRAGGRR